MIDVTAPSIPFLQENEQPKIPMKIPQTIIPIAEPIDVQMGGPGINIRCISSLVLLMTKKCLALDQF